MSNRVSKTITDDQLNRIIQIESGGNPKAKAKTSTATGLGQFLDATWMAELAQHRPDLLAGRTRAQALALRLDPSIMIEVLARFTEDNAKAIGSGFSGGDLYLAHFLGVGAARKFYQADPGVSAELLAGPAAVRANRSILQGKTAGQVRAWADKRMAQSGKTDWIKKFWTGSAVGMLGDPEVEEETSTDVNEPTEEEERKAKVWVIQERLKTMEYFPGRLDGFWGGHTAGALTGFLNDVPEEVAFAAPKSDQEFWASYDQIGDLTKKHAPSFRRPKSEDRKTAEAEDLIVEGIVAPKETWWARTWGKIAFFFTGGTAGVGLISETVETAKKPYDWAQENLPWILTKWWFYVGIVGIATSTAIWIYTRRAEAATIEDYRKGRLS